MTSRIYHDQVGGYRSLCEEASSIALALCIIHDFPVPMVTSFTDFRFWGSTVRVTWRRSDRLDGELYIEFPSDYMYRKDWKDVELSRKMGHRMDHLKMANVAKIIPLADAARRLRQGNRRTG